MLRCFVPAHALPPPNIVMPAARSCQHVPQEDTDKERRASLHPLVEKVASLMPADSFVYPCSRQ